MVMSTGTIRPSLACAWVCALNSLQKPMMLTPCCPSAGPTGGEGFALPAGSCSFTIPVIFFIERSSGWSSGRLRPSTGIGRLPASCSGLLDLHEIELDRGGAAEDRDQHPDPTLVGVHFLDRAVEVGEGAVDHADVVALLELDLGLRLERALGELGGQPRDLRFGDGRRVGGVPDEAGDLGRVLHQVPGAVVQLHLDQDVTREELALGRALLTLHHLDDVLHRDEDVAEELFEGVLLDALLERLLRLVLEARVRVHHVPLLGGLAHAGGLGVHHRLGFWILSVRNCQKTSKRPSREAAIRLATMTATVAARVSTALGQVTLRSSATISSETSCIRAERYIHAAAEKAMPSPIRVQ